jgi:hypothetical protein
MYIADANPAVCDTSTNLLETTIQEQFFSSVWGAGAIFIT